MRHIRTSQDRATVAQARQKEGGREGGKKAGRGRPAEKGVETLPPPIENTGKARDKTGEDDRPIGFRKCYRQPIKGEVSGNLTGNFKSQRASDTE